MEVRSARAVDSVDLQHGQLVVRVILHHHPTVAISLAVDGFMARMGEEAVKPVVCEAAAGEDSPSNGRMEQTERCSA
jgi:hypothetical protein